METVKWLHHLWKGGSTLYKFQDWHERFRDLHEDLEDHTRVGWPSFFQKVLKQLQILVLVA